MPTVKAPGTEKRTTFFPFHSLVESLVAVHGPPCYRADRDNRWDGLLTDTTGGVIVELWGVGNVGKGALRDGVANLDSGGHCDRWCGVGIENWGNGRDAIAGLPRPPMSFKSSLDGHVTLRAS